MRSGLLLLLLVGGLAAAAPPATALSLAAPECALQTAVLAHLQPRLARTDGGFLAFTPFGTTLTDLDGNSHGLVPSTVAVAVSPDGRWAVLPFHPSAVAAWRLFAERMDNTSSPGRWAEGRVPPPFAPSACDLLVPTAVELATGQEFPLEGRGATVVASSAAGVALVSGPLLHTYRWGEWDGPTRIHLRDLPVAGDGPQGANDSFWPPGRPAIGSLLLSPDGGLLAVLPADGDPALRLYNATTGEVWDSFVPVLRFGFATRVEGAGFSPDGAALAVLTAEEGPDGSRRGTLHVLDLFPVNLRASVAVQGNPSSVAWLPQGILASAQDPVGAGNQLDLLHPGDLSLLATAEAAIVHGAVGSPSGIVTLEAEGHPPMRLSLRDGDLRVLRTVPLVPTAFRFELPAFQPVPDPGLTLPHPEIHQDIFPPSARDLPPAGALALLVVAAGAAALRRAR